MSKRCGNWPWRYTDLWPCPVNSLVVTLANYQPAARLRLVCPGNKPNQSGQDMKCTYSPECSVNVQLMGGYYMEHTMLFQLSLKVMKHLDVRLNQRKETDKL